MKSYVIAADGFEGLSKRGNVIKSVTACLPSSIVSKTWPTKSALETVMVDCQKSYTDGIRIRNQVCRIWDIEAVFGSFCR